MLHTVTVETPGVPSLTASQLVDLVPVCYLPKWEEFAARSTSRIESVRLNSISGSAIDPIAMIDCELRDESLGPQLYRWHLYYDIVRARYKMLSRIDWSIAEERHIVKHTTAEVTLDGRSRDVIEAAIARAALEEGPDVA